MATVTVYECTSGATVIANVPGEFGDSSPVPSCADGGSWKTITYMESVPEEFNSDTALWAFGAVVLLWTIGLAVGVVVGIVRKARSS